MLSRRAFLPSAVAERETGRLQQPLPLVEQSFRRRLCSSLYAAISVRRPPNGGAHAPSTLSIAIREFCSFARVSHRKIAGKKSANPLTRAHDFSRHGFSRCPRAAAEGQVRCAH